MSIIVLLVGAILSAILYRLGGAGKHGKWYDWMCESWVRDWLIPPLVLIILWLFSVPLHWLFLIVWGLMGAAFSVYYDEIFGYDNFYAHGVGVGLATFPLIWDGVHWWTILIYAVMLGLGMGIASKVAKPHTAQKELIRGALVVILLPILLI